MSTPMYDIPEHFPMPVNAAGEGPETDDLKVVRTVCWSCSEEDWPCKESTRVANASRLVYYSSVTNNTHRFMEKLGQKSLRLPLLTSEYTPVMTEPFVLVTPTYGGQGDKNAVPKQVIKFLNVESNRNLLRGVIGSGNINFGEEYCRAADIIAAKCGVPRLYRFELMGTPEDVAKVTKGLEVFWS